MMMTLHIITGLSDGGAEAVLFRLCTHDSGGEHRVISLTDAGKYGPLLEARGIPVTCLHMRRGRATPANLWRLWRAIRAARPDVVQTWMYHADLLGGVAARLAGIRNVVWGIRNSTLVPGESTPGTLFVARACAALSRFIPRRIVCCAEKARAVHAALGYDARRMEVIANGYDLSVFRPDGAAGAAVRTELGLGTEQAVIGFVARFDPQKDHSNLLRALAILQARGSLPVCLLIGTGMEAGNHVLAAMITKLGLDGCVCLLGRRTDIPAVMNALDLHVMSSSAEAFPNVLAEAMACGTPCVSTDVGDAAVILGDTGWIVPPRNPAALADAIASALAERTFPAWPRRQRAAQERIAGNFTLARMVQRYRTVWNIGLQDAEGFR